jgi:leader peptidase (prepilin peptidase) / N-methyltransferase
LTISTLSLQGNLGAVPIIAIAVVGGLWGLLADRVAARWPAHEEGVVVPRPIDWRTPIVVLVGAASAALVVVGFWPDVAHLALVGIVVAGLVVLFATDLDQRLLPDVLTYPIIPIAIGAFALGINPFVADVPAFVIAAIGAVIVPLGLYLLSLPFGPGSIGIGDLKLLVGMGLLVGAPRLLAGLAGGALLAAATIIVLIAARRIRLSSYVPYGPFLILGALWAILVLADVA